MTAQTAFLIKAEQAARAAGHIFPEMAACEAALESGWGLSKLAEEANNLFGQKQDRGATEGDGTCLLPTREFIHGAWITVNASWVKYPDWRACFAGRMEILHALSREYDTYAAALQAPDAETFIHEVSKRWSTDPLRAAKVLSIYDAHRDILAAKELSSRPERAEVARGVEQPVLNLPKGSAVPRPGCDSEPHAPLKPPSA